MMCVQAYMPVNYSDCCRLLSVLVHWWTVFYSILTVLIDVLIMHLLLIVIMIRLWNVCLRLHFLLYQLRTVGLVVNMLYPDGLTMLRINIMQPGLLTWTGSGAAGLVVVLFLY